MRRGRIYGELNMKNTRDNRQTQVKNCLKWTASGLLLALMFVLVFAGTLSGAFGIENELQQNGIIQSNVASAAGTTSVSGFSEYLFKFSDFNHNSENGTSMGQDRGIVHVKNSTWTTRSAIYSYVSLTGDILKHIQAGASVTATLSFYGDDSGNADKWGAGILSRQPKYGDVKTDSNYWADSTAAGFYNRSVINDNTGPKNTKSASVKLYDPQEQPTRITSFYVGLFVKADYAMDIGFHDIKLTFTYSYDYPVTFSATTGGTVSKAIDNITGSNGNAEKKATSTASVATLGYHFVNWTKGNTSTEYSQNETIEIGSSDFLNMIHTKQTLHSIDSMLFIGRIIQKQTTPLGLIRLHIHNQRLLEICPKMVIKLLSGGLRQETVQSCMDTIQQLTAECNQSEIRVSCRPKMIMQL